MTWKGGKSHQQQQQQQHQHQHHHQITQPVHHDGNYQHLAAGTEISIFYRFEYDGSGDGPTAYFPVRSPTDGQMMPRMGKTDCWQPAQVVKDFHPQYFDPNKVYQTGILVKLHHAHWYNKHGNLLDTTSPKNTEIYIHPADVKIGNQPLPTPAVSFVCVRWGGFLKTPDYNELAGEEGGWGSIGTSISDGYIKAVFDRVYQRLGPTYEVLTCYVSSKADLQNTTAQAVLPHLENPNFMAGCYFLWPTSSIDGSSRTPGYVEKDGLFTCMKGLELGGVATAFPHPSPLYEMLVSKEWTSFLSGNLGGLRVPATTRVMRSSIQRNSQAAADAVVSSLSELAGRPITAGVAKLGYSWEACDVLGFKNKWDLSKKLKTLVSAAGCLSTGVICQEFIESDLEIRVYCTGGQPVKMLYTKFCEKREDGSFTSFVSTTRETAINSWMGGCEKSMTSAEDQIIALTSRWISWMRGIDPTTPPFIRLDFFVKHTGPNTPAVIHTGEITETGASCLGWADGWTATFDAVIEAATGTPPTTSLKALRVSTDRVHSTYHDQQLPTGGGGGGGGVGGAGGKRSKHNHSHQHNQHPHHNPHHPNSNYAFQ